MFSRLILFVSLLCSLFVTPRAVASSAFDAIDRAYAPYLDKADPFGFDLKIASLATDEYKFWRGSKDLFFLWCKDNAADWLADRDGFLPNHGDLHLGNIGTYVSEEGFGKMAFGMVDFDDSARLPFEVELLQGAITLRLVARQNHLEGIDTAAIDAAMFDAYRIAVNSRRNATVMLADNAVVKELMSASPSSEPYAAEVEKFTKHDRFKHVIGKKSPSDVLQPVEEDRWDAFAQAIASAIGSDEELAKRFALKDAQDIRKRMKDVARRTRIGSSGSQGLAKYFVLIERPFKDYDGDVILYLKQQIPTAAERSEYVPRDPRTPGERCKRDMDALTEPHAFANGFCELEGKSFWFSFKEPWSDEIAFDKIKTADELLDIAKLWGTVAGCTHREEGRFERILPRLTPALKQSIASRADAYLKYQQEAFASFKDDPRAVQAVARATQALDELTKKK
jgi:uncharacterized protein (DUF2252 family)